MFALSSLLQHHKEFFSPQKLQSCGELATRLPAPQRRARSLDRRTSETFMTVSQLSFHCVLIDRADQTDECLCLQPDLLNFKKGWMVKLEGTDQVKNC